MAEDEDRPARLTGAQRAQLKREEKLAHVQEEIGSGRMTTRQLTPDEMEAHRKRREEMQAQRRTRKS